MHMLATLHVFRELVLICMLSCCVRLKLQMYGVDICLCLFAGKYMLAHAASAQGISAVENMCGREHVLDHNTVPAACFTHPEVCLLICCSQQAHACTLVHFKHIICEAISVACAP